MIKREKLKLYAITDSSWLNGDTLAHQVELAIAGGATIVQLREKNKSKEALKELALEIKSVCNRYKVPFIVNDDVELAKEIDADGVHVGQNDASVKSARQILGADKIVGATAKTIEQAQIAQEQGADYLGSGAVFGSTTKKDALPMTMELLNEICHSVQIPVVAIGGIDATNIGQLKGTGIAGAAVVSGVFAQPDIKEACKNLIEQLDWIQK
ncbi:MAG: thiamine phosphate synthase [Agathobacter sp.]|nr:thiamine phosphate synthase [Agathobacter sp.]